MTILEDERFDLITSLIREFAEVNELEFKQETVDQLGILMDVYGLSVGDAYGKAYGPNPQVPIDETVVRLELED